jgi:hypothetical protein
MQLFSYMVEQDQADVREFETQKAASLAREAIACECRPNNPHLCRLLLTRAEGHLGPSNVMVGRVDNTAAPARSDH